MTIRAAVYRSSGGGLQSQVQLSFEEPRARVMLNKNARTGAVLVAPSLSPGNGRFVFLRGVTV